MKKADMVVTILNELKEKEDNYHLYAKAFGEDSDVTKHALVEMVTLYSLAKELKLID